MSVNVLSYNIHKGFNWNNSKLVLEKIKEVIQGTDAEIVFLQEVVGSNSQMKDRMHNWVEDQFEYIADKCWSEFAYAKNAVFAHKHHGNAILSKFPINKFQQINISTNTFEQRGVLFCEINHPQGVIHCYCVHLNLFHKSRKSQYEKIIDIIKRNSPKNTPIIIAGDFNDWNKKASTFFEKTNHFKEVHKFIHFKYAKTFPAALPLLSLDRIYIKNLEPIHADILRSPICRSLSDHIPILAKIGFNK